MNIKASSLTLKIRRAFNPSDVPIIAFSIKFSGFCKEMKGFILWDQLIMFIFVHTMMKIFQAGIRIVKWMY